MHRHTHCVSQNVTTYSKISWIRTVHLQNFWHTYYKDYRPSTGIFSFQPHLFSVKTINIVNSALSCRLSQYYNINWETVTILFYLQFKQTIGNHMPTLHIDAYYWITYYQIVQYVFIKVFTIYFSLHSWTTKATPSNRNIKWCLLPGLQI